MTQPVKADPAAMRAYAKQLMGNVDNVADLRSYCDKHCTDTDGLSGILLIQVPPVVKYLQDIQHTATKSINSALERDARRLDDTASAYERTDQAAAEQIWAAIKKPTDGQYIVDGSHTGDFADPVDIAPAPPAYMNEMQEKIEHVLGVLKDIDRWLEKVVHYSVFEDLAPYLIGDWGLVRQLARGYALLGGAAGTQGVDLNVRHGTDSLAPLWDGPAAETCEMRFRIAWHNTFSTWTDMCKVSEELLEVIAKGAEEIFVNLEVAVTSALIAVAAIVAELVGAMMTAAGLVRAAAMFHKLWNAVENLVHAYEFAFKTMKGLIELAVEEAQALWAMARLLINHAEGAGTV